MKFDVVEPASWMVIPHTLHEAVRLLPACTKSLKPNEITNGTAPAEPAAAMVCLSVFQIFASPARMRCAYEGRKIFSLSPIFTPCKYFS